MAKPPLPFSEEAWKAFRPHALNLVIETGLYLRYWISVLVAHVVRLAMAIIGVEPGVVKIVAWMEKWVFLASFASFFWRLLVRLYRETRRETL
jgi:hypothetical protein